MKKILFALVFIVTTGIVNAGNDEDHYKVGLAAYDDKNYSEAHKEFEISARQGGAAAQAMLGFMYYSGVGVRQDYVEALKWTRLSANKGVPPSERLLGGMYKLGLGVKQDYFEAFKWAWPFNTGDEKEARCCRVAPFSRFFAYIDNSCQEFSNGNDES
jgi:Sel1 repeat